MKQDDYRIPGNSHGEPAPTVEGLRKALLVAMFDPRNVIFGLGDTLIFVFRMRTRIGNVFTSNPKRLRLLSLYF